MHLISPSTKKVFRFYNEKSLYKIPQIEKLDKSILHEIKVVASVLPFRVNNFVVDDLIDWDNFINDPIFRITFPNKDMLDINDYNAISNLMLTENNQIEIQNLVAQIRLKLNPHPGEQREKNIPIEDGHVVDGIQHKYKETVLFFPSQGQTCHSYCNFCFRWAQFIGEDDLRFASSNPSDLLNYLSGHKEVTDLLLTGGDPFFARTKYLSNYLEPMLNKQYDHIANIRIGTKALTFWPYRFINDHDSDELLRLLEKLVKNGKHVSIMAHYNHWKELEPEITHVAINRVRETGAIIRAQGPLLANINDQAEIWTKLWNK